MAFNYKENVPSSSCGCPREYLVGPCIHNLCAELDSSYNIIYRHVNSPGHPPVRSGIYGYDMHDNISHGHIAPCSLKVRLSSMFSQCYCTDCEENNGEYYAYATYITNPLITSPVPQISQWVFTPCTASKPFEGCGYSHGIVTLEAAITGFGQTEYDIEMHCRLYQDNTATVLSTPSHHRKQVVGRVSNYGSNFNCRSFPQTSLNTYVTGTDVKCSAPTILVEPWGEGHFLNPPYDQYSSNKSTLASASYYAGSCLESGQSLAPSPLPHQVVTNNAPWYQSMNVGNHTRDVIVHIAGSQNGGGVSGIYACSECTRLDGAHMLLEDPSSAQSDGNRTYSKYFDNYDYIAQTPLPYASGNTKKLCCVTCDRPAASSMCLSSMFLNIQSGVQTFTLFGTVLGTSTVMSRYTRDMPADIMNWNTLTGFTYQSAGITNPLRNQCNYKDLTLTAVNMSPPTNPIAFDCLPKFKHNGWKGGASPDAIRVSFTNMWLRDIHRRIKIVPGTCHGWGNLPSTYCTCAELNCGYPSVGGGPVGDFILTKGNFEYNDDCVDDYRCPFITSYKYFSGNTTNPCEFMSIEAFIGGPPLAAFTCANVMNGFYPFENSAGSLNSSGPQYIFVYVRWPEWNQTSNACPVVPCGRSWSFELLSGCNGILKDGSYNPAGPHYSVRRSLFVGALDNPTTCGGMTFHDPNSWSATLTPCSRTFELAAARCSEQGFPSNVGVISGWSSLTATITAGNV